MAVPPRLGVFPPAHPTSTRVPANGTLEQKLQVLAQAIDRRAELNSVPSFAALILMDEAGVQWRVTISTSGVLQTQTIPVRP